MEPVVVELISVLVTLIAAVVAYIQNQQKKEVLKFYDQTVPDAQITVATVGEIPRHTFVMNADTKKFLLAGCTEQEKAQILDQIKEAEDKNLREYYIHYGEGGMYHIAFGALLASNGQVSYVSNVDQSSSNQRGKSG